MSNLKEIEARHQSDAQNCPHLGWNNHRDAHRDRAFLLAEVKRLKALCGRAAEFIGWTKEPSLQEERLLVTELKEASHE